MTNRDWKKNKIKHGFLQVKSRSDKDFISRLSEDREDSGIDLPSKDQMHGESLVDRKAPFD